MSETFRRTKIIVTLGPATESEAMLENAILHLRRLGRVAPGDKLIVATDILSQDRLVESVQLRTVQ